MSTPMTIVSRLHGAGFLIGPAADHDCSRCGHLWGNHMLFASVSNDPLDGGHVECPYLGCTCQSSWSLTDEQRVQARHARDRGEP